MKINRNRRSRLISAQLRYDEAVLRSLIEINKSTSALLTMLIDGQVEINEYSSDAVNNPQMTADELFISIVQLSQAFSIWNAELKRIWDMYMTHAARAAIEEHDLYQRQQITC